jgi:hypothetical protein
MVETRGFSFTPRVAGPGVLAAPVPLRFVDGASLVPDIGISEWARGAQQATQNLLSGVQLGVDALTKGAIGLAEIKRAQSEKAEQRAYDEEKDLRDFEQAKVLAGMRSDRPLTALQEAQLEGTGLRNRILEEKLRDPYEAYFGPAGDKYVDEASLDIAPDYSMDFEPSSLANVEPPLPEDEGAPAALATPKSDTYVTGNGMLIITNIPKEAGGGRMIINRATGATTIDKGAGDKVETTAAGLPEELKNDLRLKGVTVNAKGEVSTTYEPSTAEADRVKEIGMMQQQIDAANRVVRDIDTIIKSGSSARLPATGKFSDWLASMPITTGASDVRALINNIEADVAFKTLADMRRNSPTGGALGAISDKELSLLAAAEGSINPSLSWPIFKRNLEAIRDARKELTRMWSGKLSDMGAGTSASDLTSEINSLAERLDDMDDKNSEEYRAGRERLKELVRRQRGQ